LHGVDPLAYASLLRALEGEGASAAEIEIARATPPGRSRAGYFEAAFHRGLQPGHLREDGTMDFRDRELLKPVSAGEKLGVVHPPWEGAPGLRVDGLPIAGEPAPAFTFHIGEGTELVADDRVVATRAGVIIYVEGRSIEVGNHYLHDGDVDLRCGDLSMVGSLVVKKDVQRGFCVRATGDIEIKGGVEGGSAHAGANLRVSGGVRGSEGSMVAAEGDLRAHHAERARLVCGGVLDVVNAVNSRLSAVHIRVERSLRGGRASVEIGLVARDLGTEVAYGETMIEAAVLREEPDAAARAALEAAKAERMGARRAPADARATLFERSKGGKIERDLLLVKRSALARKIERADRASALLPLAFIEVRGVAYPGVHVRIGHARLELEKAVHGVRFTFDVERRTIRMEAPKT
jgi:uncharacterized protein (DUF342 family)